MCTTDAEMREEWRQSSRDYLVFVLRRRRTSRSRGCTSVRARIDSGLVARVARRLREASDRIAGGDRLRLVLDDLPEGYDPDKTPEERDG